MLSTVRGVKRVLRRLFTILRLHHHMKKAMVLRATTPPMTPPATATVDWTVLPFEAGTALTAPLVDEVASVDCSAGSLVGAVPMVVNWALTPPSVGVGAIVISENCCIVALAVASEAVVMLVSA
jgi:hypothetical protein